MRVETFQNGVLVEAFDDGQPVPPPPPKRVTLLDIRDSCGMDCADAIHDTLKHLSTTGVTSQDGERVSGWMLAGALGRMMSLDGVDVNHALTQTLLSLLVSQGTITAEQVEAITR